MQLLLLSAESTNLEVCLIHGARPRHLVGLGIQGGHQKVGETHIHRVRTLRRSPAPSWFSTHSPPSYCAVRTSAGSMQISATSAARICRLVLRGLRGAPSSTPDRAGFSRSDATGRRTGPNRPPSAAEVLAPQRDHRDGEAAAPSISATYCLAGGLMRRRIGGATRSSRRQWTSRAEKGTWEKP